MLTVDPAEYAAAASQLARVGVDAAHVVSTLTGALDGSAGMAGSDHAGTAWADGYDQAARAALEAASTAVAGAGQVATLLHATGQNHAHADAASTIGGGDAALPAPPAPLRPASPSLPSAAGGIGSGPPGWSLVAGLVGYAWPNGHQDRLHAAQAAWSAAAGAMEQVASPIAAAASRVGAQRSPEAPAAASTCTQIGTHIGELAGVFTQVGQSCGEYAAHLDQAHHEIISVLRDLVVQTVAIEAGGAVLAFFTAGLDEIAAQAAVAARVASAAAKIRRVIEALIEAARVVATAVRGYLGKVVEITGKLKSVIGFGVKRAETMAVKGGERIAAKWDKFRSTREYEFNAIHNPGPLAEGEEPLSSPAVNFAGGRYNSHTLDEPTVFYRAGRSDNEFGKWYTESPPSSEAEVRIDTAVKPQWVNSQTGEYEGASPIERVWALEFPKGTQYFSGPVANQGGIYVGGHDIEQIFIDNPWNISDVKVVGSWPIE